MICLSFLSECWYYQEGVGELAQQLRLYTALTEDLSWVTVLKYTHPHTHTYPHTDKCIYFLKNSFENKGQGGFMSITNNCGSTYLNYTVHRKAYHILQLLSAVKSLETFYLVKTWEHQRWPC